jgi:signal transduction histidine kinase
LTVVALYSLRQDRLLAEQEAKERGAAIAQRVAHAVTDDMDRVLTDYNKANSLMHSNLTAYLGLSPRVGSLTDPAIWKPMWAWQQANPSIDLSNLPVCECTLTTQQISEASPLPPHWLSDLTVEQRLLWQQEESSEFITHDSNEAVSAIQEFVATKPPAGALANAEFHLLVLKTSALPAAQAVMHLAESSSSKSDELSNAGLPLGQLVCYRALRLIPDHAGVPPKLLQSLARMLAFPDSILSRTLISEAERAASPADPEHRIDLLKEWWLQEEQAREVMFDFQQQAPDNTSSNSLVWVNTSHNRFLVALDKSGTSDRLLIFPKELVDTTEHLGVGNADVTMPYYAVLDVEMGGSTEPESWRTFPVLGQATGTLSGLANTAPEVAYPFQVRVLLFSRDILYARQEQRTLLFGAVIVASMLAALAGLVSAYRVFHRQLELNELKSNFVSSVSHELRAPIASVRLMAENLEGGKIAEARKQHEYFGFIVQECRRLSSLIENVLDFSRIEQGRKQYEFEPTDLAALAATTVKLMTPYASEKGVALEFSNSAAIELKMDGRAIQQALVNLIDNAIKHSAKGETVAVGIEMKNGSPGRIASLFVIDHGPGVPKAEQEKIFERFYRRGSELRRETQGVGIGLSVVKHIVAAHGGSVTVQSEVGQGSRFTIELPVKNQDE